MLELPPSDLEERHPALQRALAVVKAAAKWGVQSLKWGLGERLLSLRVSACGGGQGLESKEMVPEDSPRPAGWDPRGLGGWGPRICLEIST